ncbi:uncharacterized protein LOC125759381 [Rhipicephalus sanguineus]|uniref:Nlr family card domain protein n=1 Tax=Rhipicephalus sanguineus TaxID=34632 RepID=A0A9D4PIW1_RHISA|nr:uncharacterized protein LOC125759381 [Rhipicephalus sanguineus]KAH7942860.1 hypothetical protein HPB52_002037 [Rhipicephalus sanguineus]
MTQKVRIGTEEMDSEEINRRFPGLRLKVPCSAKCGVSGEDGFSISTSICHIFQNLSRWNCVLGHVGLQLRELRGPGKLSLVRVAYRGQGGCMLQERSHHARILIRVLLVQHRCVESLHVDDALVEGSGLGEFRECVVSTFRENTSLRTLILGSLFSEYRSIREELFEAIATMTNLCELAVLGSAAGPLVVLDAVCKILVDTTCLATLTIPRLVYDDGSATRLIAALQRNNTVQNLSLHVSVMHSYMQNGIPRFSHFLANSTQLASLSVEGADTDPVSTFQHIKCIVAPFRIRGNLQKLRLTGFLLGAHCACLFAALVYGKKVCLKSLDIGGCRWRPKSRLQRTRDAEPSEDEQLGRPTIAHRSCRWIQAFDPTTRVQLSFMALSFEGLEPEDLRLLLKAALSVEPLKTISLRGVPLDKLKTVCRAIRETGMSGRVSIEGTYLIDSSGLYDLVDYPEALSKVAVRFFPEQTPRAFENAVRLACCWHRVTILTLSLAQSILLNGYTFRALCKCLNTNNSLRALSLNGCDDPDLSRSPRLAGHPYSLLLDMIFKNTTIQALRLNGLRMGREDLRFFVAGVVASKSLCELAFVSCDPAENDMFLKLLAPIFHRNQTISYVRLLESTDCARDDWLVIENVIGRNMGLLTCASHYFVGKDYSPRCDAALAVVFGTNALMKRVEELVNDDETTNHFRRSCGV